MAWRSPVVVPLLVTRALAAASLILPITENKTSVSRTGGEDDGLLGIELSRTPRMC